MFVVSLSPGSRSAAAVGRLNGKRSLVAVVDVIVRRRSRRRRGAEKKLASECSAAHKKEGKFQKH